MENSENSVSHWLLHHQRRPEISSSNKIFALCFSNFHSTLTLIPNDLLLQKNFAVQVLVVRTPNAKFSTVNQPVHVYLLTPAHPWLDVVTNANRTPSVDHKNSAVTGNVQNLARNAVKVRLALACRTTVLSVNVQRATSDQLSLNADQNATEMSIAQGQDQLVTMAFARTLAMVLVELTLTAISVDWHQSVPAHVTWQEIPSSAAVSSSQKTFAVQTLVVKMPSAHPDTTELNVNDQSVPAQPDTPETLSHLVFAVNVNLILNVAITALALTTHVLILALESAHLTLFVKPRAIWLFAHAQLEQLAMHSSHAVNQKVTQSPDTTVH